MDASALFKLLIHSRPSPTHSNTDVHCKFGLKSDGRLQVIETCLQAAHKLCNCSLALVRLREILER